MFAGIVALKKKGQIIPAAFFEKAVKQGFISSYGLVGASNLTLDINAGKVEPPLDTLVPDLMAMQDRVKDEDFFIYLGRYPEGFSEEDLQPFVLLSETGEKDSEKFTNPLLAALIEGDFAAHYQANGAGETQHSAEFSCSNKLVEEFQGWYDHVEESMEALLNEMDTYTAKQKLGGMIGEAGLIAIIPFDGEPRLLYKPKELLKRYDWGWYYSREFSYEEKEYPEKPKEEAQPKTGGLKSFRSKTPTASPTTPEVKSPETATAVPSTASGTPAMIKRPSAWSMWDKNQKKKWIRQFTGAVDEKGDLPKNWMDMKEFPPPKAKVLPGTAVTRPPAAEADKTAFLPILTAEEKKRVAEIYVPQLVDPTKLQEDVALKVPKFWEDMGKKYEEVRGMSREWCNKVAHGDPNFARNIIFDLNRLCIEKDAYIAELEAKITEPAKEESEKKGGLKSFRQKAG